MRCIHFIFIYCLTVLTAYGQYYNNSYRIGLEAPLSFTDVPTDVGYGLSAGYRNQLKGGLGLSIDLSIARIHGGGEALTSTKDIFFNGTLASVVPAVDYKISVLRSKKLSFIPSVGLGVIAFNTQGGFSNTDAAATFFRDWGREYFVPVFNDAGQLVDARLEGKGFGTTINPTLMIAYELSFKTSFFIKTGYAFTFTDKVDGYFVPANNNDDNDVFQLNIIGLSYLIMKR